MENKIDPKDVMWVYSGLRGCACGCRGKYSFNPAHVEAAAKDQGYPVELEAISQRSVELLTAKFNARSSMDVDDDGDSQFSFETENRLYMLKLAASAGGK